MGWFDREDDQTELLNDILGVLKENLQSSRIVETALTGKARKEEEPKPKRELTREEKRAIRGQRQRVAANRALFGRRGIQGSLLSLKNMIPTAGGVGGILGFLAWAIGNDAEYNAKTQAIINRMKSVGDVNASMFEKMKQRYLQLKVFGAEGDLGALANAMANRGVGEEAFLRRTGINIRGGDKTGQYESRDDVATVTQALDYDTGQAVGTSFEAVGQAVATTGESLESATQAMVDLRTATKGTGISFQSLLQTMTQASSALRLQTGDTKSLAAGYMFARKAMARFFGGETAENKYQVSSFAQQGFDDIVKAVANMDDTTRVLAAQSMVERDLRKKNPGASDDQIKQMVQDEIASYGGMAGFIAAANMNKFSGLDEKQSSLAWAAEYMISQLKLLGTTPEKVQAGMQRGPDGRLKDPSAGTAYGMLQMQTRLSIPAMEAGLEIAAALTRNGGDYTQAFQSEGAAKALEELKTAEERRAEEENVFRRAQEAFMQAMLKIGLGGINILRGIAGYMMATLYVLSNPTRFSSSLVAQAADEADREIASGYTLIEKGVSGAVDAVKLGLSGVKVGEEMRSFDRIRDHVHSEELRRIQRKEDAKRKGRADPTLNANDINDDMYGHGRSAMRTLPAENGEIRIYAEWVGGGAVPGSGWG